MNRTENPSLRTHFAGFVLGDFVLSVFLAVFALAVGTTGFWDVDLEDRKIISFCVIPSTYHTAFGLSLRKASWHSKRTQSRLCISVPNSPRLPKARAFFFRGYAFALVVISSLRWARSQVWAVSPERSYNFSSKARLDESKSLLDWSVVIAALSKFSASRC